MADGGPASLLDLTGRVACVTGASSGLGRRAANILAAAGASVVGVARRAEALAAWGAETDGQTASVVWDVADRDTLPDMIEAIAAPFGAPDILVLAAGINNRERADAKCPACVTAAITVPARREPEGHEPCQQQQEPSPDPIGTHRHASTTSARHRTPRWVG